MPLTAGTKLGPYEVVAPLGVGGMGEVYRARDSKLHRDVAIKVLLPAVADDPDRMARFSREAQVLASLNHPNIAHIYGLDRQEAQGGDAFAFIVMELADGEELAQRIARGPLPLDEALPIARQIAEALEAAHEQGIVHRDLKPANIKVRDDGTVKVLDFGLARAMDPAGASSANAMMSPTLSLHATQAGIILGTAAYMSPEQAKGRTADKRSDVWSFGCVLYEMLTGKRAFDGEDVSDILATVLKSEPDFSAFPADVPPHIRTVVQRCLAKDRKARIADISTVRFVMDEAASLPAHPAVAAVAPPLSSKSSIVWKAAVGLLLLTTLAGFASAYLARSVPAPVTRFFVAPPDKTTFVTTQRNATSVAISPDGRTLAFTARDAAGKILVWVRPIDSLTAQPLAGTDDAANPFWSPDSRFIAYGASGKLLKIAAVGGPPQTLCALNANNGRGGAWSRDGVIVFNTGPAGLFRVSSAGGQPASMKMSETTFPSFLPDGRHVLFFGNGSSSEGPGVYVTSLDGGESKRLLTADSGGVYAARSGHLLFVRQGTLMAQPFNPKTLALADEPFPIAERVEISAIPGLLSFSVSETGVLAYGTGLGSLGGLQMVWVDRQGKSLGTVGPTANYRGLDLSPDGTRVATHRHDGQGGDIWLTELVRGNTTRFTFDASQDNSSPIWSPDGSQIAYGSLRGGKWGLYLKPSNGAGSEERLVESDVQVLPASWSPDGRSIVYGVSDPKTAADLWVLPLTGDRKSTALLHTEFSESHGQVSPDGKWLAYYSNETGRSEVYVQPFPSGAGKWQVSANGGQFPRWRRDGRELFYMSQGSVGKLVAVDVKATGSTFETGTPRELFDSGYINLITGGGRYHTFAVSPDGQRFLIPRPESAAPETQAPIVVVLNWADGIRK